MAPRKKTRAFSKVAAGTTAQEKSKLMALPPELRNRIYTLVCPGEVIHVPWRRKHNLYGRTSFPGILMACKQTHFEAIRIFYSNVAFQFQDFQIRGAIGGKRLPQWIKDIGPLRRDLIMDIHLMNHILSWRDDQPPPRILEPLASHDLLQTANSQFDLAPSVLKVKPGNLSSIVDDSVSVYYDYATKQELSISE